MTVVTASTEETEKFGQALGERIQAGGKIAFIALYGDLGVGKTAFVRGLASVLSPGSAVKSPTYTVVNEYRRGVLPLFHFDMYRVTDADELESIGFYDYVGRGHCVTEWSENVESDVPAGAIRVRIERVEGNENARKITCTEEIG